MEKSKKNHLNFSSFIFHFSSFISSHFPILIFHFSSFIFHLLALFHLSFFLLASKKGAVCANNPIKTLVSHKNQRNFAATKDNKNCKEETSQSSHPQELKR
jgi:hypothetical protein